MPDAHGGTATGVDVETAPRAPRWVKAFGVAFLVLVPLVVVMMVGGHGPGRHT